MNDLKAEEIRVKLNTNISTSILPDTLYPTNTPSTL